jgi:D-alanyl-D-alanine endopeptidase (penicillin-binding protein 7)
LQNYRWLLLILVSLSSVSAGAAQAAAAGTVPEVRSQAVLVLDTATGSELYSRHKTDAAPIASITKLMTALVVLDGAQSLDEELAIAPADVAGTHAEPSRLLVGTRLTRRELLLLALMSSENRAAHALARSYPGGMAAFVTAMNAKALQLGMQQTRFEDPTGLSAHNVASPSDLARLVLAADGSALIREFSTTPVHAVRVGRQLTEFRNTNPLVRDPGWELSVQKTGHIAAAGQCMVLLNSFGKYTRVADARRIRRWMASLAPTGEALVNTSSALPQRGSSQSISGT